MFIIGERAMLTPFPRNSFPMREPWLSINSLSQVAATFIEAGKAETLNAYRTPVGESCKHKPLKFGMDGTAAMLPTQAPFVQPTPEARVTFSSRDSLDT